MWRRFARQPWIRSSSFNNPRITTISQAQVKRIHRAPNISNTNTNNFNSSSSSYCYYSSVVVSPPNKQPPIYQGWWFMPNNIQTRFMSTDDTASTNSETSIGIGNDINNEIKHKEAEPLDAVKVSCDCFEAMGEEYQKALLNYDYFAKTIKDIPEGMPLEIIDLYVIWAIGRDDFKIDHNMLKLIIKTYTSSPSRWNRKVVYRIWEMMLKRSAVFKEEGVVTTYMLTELLGGFPTEFVLPSDHIDMLEKFGCLPDLAGYALFAACSLQNLSDEDRDRCVARIRQNILDIVGSQPLVRQWMVTNSIDYFCSYQLYKWAHFVYDAAKDKLDPPFPLGWEVFHLIRLLSHQDDTLYLAVEMLEGLSSDAARTSKKKGSGSAAAFSSVVTALCRVNDSHAARKLIDQMILKGGPPPGIRLFNALIKSLCLAGDLEGAFDVLQLAENRGLKPALGSYRLLIKGFKKRGSIDQASNLMSMAAHKHPTSTLKV